MRAKEFDTCYNLAVKMYDDLKDKDRDPKLVQVAGYKGDPDLADERWQEIPVKNWHHYVVIDGNTVLDPSHRQFGSEELSYSKDMLKLLWDKVYEIK